MRESREQIALRKLAYEHEQERAEAFQSATARFIAATATGIIDHEALAEMKALHQARRGEA